jgi:hypothetical protein
MRRRKTVEKLGVPEFEPWLEQSLARLYLPRIRTSDYEGSFPLGILEGLRPNKMWKIEYFWLPFMRMIFHPNV